MKESRWEVRFSRVRKDVEMMSTQSLNNIGISKKAKQLFLETIQNGKQIPSKYTIK